MNELDFHNAVKLPTSPHSSEFGSGEPFEYECKLTERKTPRNQYGTCVSGRLSDVC
jgi:hypothetical protein